MYSKRVPDYKRVEAEDFLRQQRIVFSTSLNPNSQEIRAGFLQQGLKTYNKDRRLSFLPKITLDDYCKIVHHTTLYKFMTKPFSVQKYYQSKGRYLNNVKPKL